jgi:4-hydroxy-2-oxoheptanedioate aldolase
MVGPQRPSLKAKLAAGETLLGSLVAFDAPWLVEIVGRAGFDFVTMDIEHEAFDEQAVVNMIRAADSAGLPAIARMPISDRLLAYLDAGVSGVKIPDLRSRQHAEELVSLTHFHPEGRRTYYTMGRAAGYGIGIEDKQWLAQANEEMFVMAMIEDIEVVSQLDDILAVDGVDAFHVGPHDLAQSMGFPSPERLNEVIAGIVSRVMAAGKHISVGVVTPWNLEQARRWMDLGCRIMTVGSTWVVSHAVVDMHNQLRGRVPGDGTTRPMATVSRSGYLGASGSGAAGGGDGQP